MTHRLTHSLALALHGADSSDYEVTAAVIEDLTEGYSDERKADLYALIQEAVNRDMAFIELSGTIDHCLRKNEEHFLHG